MKYRVINDKGQGGFGLVQHVIDEKGNNCAMKTFAIHPSMQAIEEQAKKRFIKEAKYQQQIDHPNVVKIIDLSTTENPPFFTMPLADASMYDDILSGKLDKTNFLKCFYDIMAGLEEIHSLHIYHRDLKPANVLRFNQNYAIGDFGLMSLDQTGVTTLTSTGMAKTSDLYTAPEITQDLKSASIQSDIYSLGCILHDFVGQSKRIPCNEIIETSDYADILLASTRKDPTRRFSSVASFREALNSISKDTATVKTIAAENILGSLRKDINDFDETDIAALADFLGSNIVQEEKNTILGEITIGHIQRIKNSARHNQYIAKTYFEYVRVSSFQWDFCDTLANRVLTFMENGNIDVISDGIFALLYMGASHNRWYVEGKVVKFFCGDIEDRLLKRIKMEIRVEDKRFCRAIFHLFHSINYNLESLNLEIQGVIKEVCSK